MPNLTIFVGLFGNSLGSLFGTNILLGIVGILIFFFLAYKFNLPPIIMMLTIAIAGFFMGTILLGDWVKALVIIVLCTIIGVLLYRLIQGGGY